MIFKKKTTVVLDSSEELLRLKIAAEKSDLRWKRAKRLLFGGLTVWTLVAVGITSKISWEANQRAHAPVVRIEGGIAGDNSKHSADSVIKKLKVAFDDDKAPAVIVYIDSPGGSPAEAERINNYIERRKQETGKQLYSVCANMCASAGYMIAMQADEIYASKYSLVGSIGAVLSSWNFSEAINKLGVQHNAYASGKLKAMLNPYAPTRTEDQEKAQILVNGMGKIFAAEVQERRKGKLTSTTDLFTGEVWDGNEAKAHGLVDSIGTLDDVIRDKFPENALVRDLTQSGKGLLFLRSAAETITLSIRDVLLQTGHISTH